MHQYAYLGIRMLNIFYLRTPSKRPFKTNNTQTILLNFPQQSLRRHRSCPANSPTFAAVVPFAGAVRRIPIVDSPGWSSNTTAVRADIDHGLAPDSARLSPIMPSQPGTPLAPSFQCSL